MNDGDKTKDQLVRELVELRQRLPELEKQQTRLTRTKGSTEQQAVFLDLILESLPNPYLCH